MITLTVGIGSAADAKPRFFETAAALDGKAQAATPALYVASDDLHRVLAPARLAIVRAMAGQGPLAIREVARRVSRDVTTLADAGGVDRSDEGVTLPDDRIRFAFAIDVAA